jgi:hypothetical protein
LLLSVLSLLGASVRGCAHVEPPSHPAPLPIAAIAPSAPIAPPTPTPVATPKAPEESVATSTEPAILVEPQAPDIAGDGADEPEKDEPGIEDHDALASIAKETWVFAEPRWSARKLGYLRAGAVVERSASPAGRSGCDGGWYRIEPHGFVCVGATATLDVHHAVVGASTRRPRRDGLPYTYVMARSPTPPFYARLPSGDEQQKSEPDLPRHLRKLREVERDPSFVAPPDPDPIPTALLDGGRAPALANVERSPDTLVLGHALARSGFALLSTFDHEGRRFGLTTELAVLPIDRTRVIQASSFHGIPLEGDVTLPIVFVRQKHAFHYEPREGGRVERGAPIAFREAIPITGRELRVGGVRYLEARDGTLVRDEALVRVDPPAKLPTFANRRWIDVSIIHQTLVAYEGKTPVYVTLVSTGADGLGDPKTTHSTIQGAFLIHTKHVSVTMDGDDVGDEFDLRDVPFVQYFTQGFALHAAYWHDDFGNPHSHGCVNLAPTDAAWLFNWTTPEVPAAWHAALGLKKGTVVYTHP